MSELICRIYRHRWVEAAFGLWRGCERCGALEARDIPRKCWVRVKIRKQRQHRSKGT